MSEVTGGATFLVMWIGFMLLVTAGSSIFLLWAVRARQFSDQERARHLALSSGIPGDTEPVEPKEAEQCRQK